MPAAGLHMIPECHDGSASRLWRSCLVLRAGTHLVTWLGFSFCQSRNFSAEIFARPSSITLDILFAGYSL